VHETDLLDLLTKSGRPHCVEQSLIDSTVDQWPAYLRACVYAKGGHFKHTLWLSVCFLGSWWTLRFTSCL